MLTRPWMKVWAIIALTFLRSSQPPFSPAELVADAHEHLTKASSLPWRKDHDASDIVVVPAHLLFAEEADDLLLGRIVVFECQ